MRNWAGKCGYVLSEKALCPTIRKDRARTSGGKEKWVDNKIWWVPDIQTTLVGWGGALSGSCARN